MMLTYKML